VITINQGKTPVTVINVFTVAKERQTELVGMLDEFAAKVVRHRPGFISTSVHASLDGTRVINYAQWETDGHLAAALTAPEAQAQLRAIVQVAATEPNLYEVAKVHEK
jgi:quinol monooxygenase YgiN